MPDMRVFSPLTWQHLLMQKKLHQEVFCLTAGFPGLVYRQRRRALSLPNASSKWGIALLPPVHFLGSSRKTRPRTEAALSGGVFYFAHFSEAPLCSFPPLNPFKTKGLSPAVLNCLQTVLGILGAVPVRQPALRFSTHLPNGKRTLFLPARNFKTRKQPRTAYCCPGPLFMGIRCFLKA